MRSDDELLSPCSRQALTRPISLATSSAMMIEHFDRKPNSAAIGLW